MPKKGYRVRKYKGDPFKPRPELRVASKSRRHHPASQPRNGGDHYCPREWERNEKTGRDVVRCVNHKKCDRCFRYSLFREKK